MRKKPTNLTLSDEIRMRGRHIMQQRGFTNFTAFVEQLIREAWERHVPPVLNPPPAALRDAPNSAASANPEAVRAQAVAVAQKLYRKKTAKAKPLKQ